MPVETPAIPVSSPALGRLAERFPQMEGSLDPKTEKMWELIENEEFLVSLLEFEEPEQVQAAFAAKGVELNLDEVKMMGQIIETVLENGGELTEEDLEAE